MMVSIAEATAAILLAASIGFTVGYRIGWMNGIKLAAAKFEEWFIRYREDQSKES